MYLATSTRPDIAFAASYLSRFVSNPGPRHWNAVKKVMRYLAGTIRMGLHFEREPGVMSSEMTSVDIRGYTDASWADDLDRRRSTIGYVVYVMSCPVAWKSKLSACVATSTMEAELVAANEGVREVLWIRHMTSEVMGGDVHPSVLYVDNAPAIQTMVDRRVTDRNKHIDVKHWFILEQQEAGSIVLQKVTSAECVADTLTKALPTILFDRHRMSPRILVCD